MPSSWKCLVYWFSAYLRSCDTYIFPFDRSQLTVCLLLHFIKSNIKYQLPLFVCSWDLHTNFSCFNMTRISTCTKNLLNNLLPQSTVCHCRRQEGRKTEGVTGLRYTQLQLQFDLQMTLETWQATQVENLARNPSEICKVVNCTKCRYTFASWACRNTSIESVNVCFKFGY